MSVLDEFRRRFDEAQEASPFYKGGGGPYAAFVVDEPGPAPRGFNPRVIVVRLVLNTESPDEAEAFVEGLQGFVRGFRVGSTGVDYGGYAITTKTAME